MQNRVFVSAIRASAHRSALRAAAQSSPYAVRNFAAAEEEAEPLSFAERVIRAKPLGGNRFEFEFDKPFEVHKFDLPEPRAETTTEEMLLLYEQMLLCRRVEMAADGLYKQRLIRGFLHLCNGQEAIAFGMERAITWEDHIITAYRDHGQALARGVSAKEVLAELLGKFGGISRGKGGSMHMYHRGNNFYGGNGIVGAQCPTGAGIAFAAKYRKTGKVCYSLYGDGAANQGQLYEAFNMAAIWKLPVVFCCENNHYGMGTAVKRASATLTWYTRGDYIPGIKLDGMDPLAVKKATSIAADWCRAGNGPMVLEFETYRYVGHSMSDAGTSYRTRDEVDSVRVQRDPIERMKARLLFNKIATPEAIKAIDKRCKAIVDEAVEYAKTTPEPPLVESYTDVYSEPTPIRGRSMYEWYHPSA